MGKFKEILKRQELEKKIPNSGIIATIIEKKPSKILKDALGQLPIKWNWKSWEAIGDSLFPSDLQAEMQGRFKNRKVYFSIKRNSWGGIYKMSLDNETYSKKRGAKGTTIPTFIENVKDFLSTI